MTRKLFRFLLAHLIVATCFWCFVAFIAFLFATIHWFLAAAVWAIAGAWCFFGLTIYIAYLERTEAA